MKLLGHIAQIPNAAARLPLLCATFPICLIEQMARHPNKRRLLERSFYAFSAAVFWAAWEGLFVGVRR